jgi:hypothetical protein
VSAPHKLKVDFGVVLDLFKIKIESKIKTKSSGQECPLHTGCRTVGGLDGSKAPVLAVLRFSHPTY